MLCCPGNAVYHCCHPPVEPKCALTVKMSSALLHSYAKYVFLYAKAKMNFLTYTEKNCCRWLLISMKINSVGLFFGCYLNVLSWTSQEIEIDFGDTVSIFIHGPSN